MPTPLRVLILEDRPDEAELLARELCRADFALEWQLADCESAYLASLETPIDLILADYYLPGFDALRALELCRERGLDIPLIVVTGSLREELAVECIKRGAADYLQKDRLARLGPAVRHALEQQQLRAEKRRAERALWESEALNRSVLSSLTAHIAVLDRDGTIVAVNKAWEHYARENGDPTLARTGVGVNYLAACRAAGPYDEEASQALEGLSAVLAGTLEQFRFEYTCHTPNEKQWFILRATPLDERGGAVVAHEDITERKRMERVLRESEERFRRYFELGLIGMAITSPTKGVLEVNDQICAILGYERSELLQMNWAEMTHPDDLAADVAQFNRVMAGEIDGYPIDKRWIRKDGQVVHTTISVKCLRRADGSVEYFVALVQDISARKQADQMRSRLAAIVDASDDAIIGKSLDGTIVSWNAGAERIYGYTAAEAIGSTISELLAPADSDEEGQLLERIRRRERIAHYESVHTTRNGRMIDVSRTISPIIDASGQVVGVSTIARDISERKRGEQALAQKNVFIRLLQVVAMAANEARSLNDALQTAVFQICTHLAWPIGHVLLPAEGAGDGLRPTDIWHIDDPVGFARFRAASEVPGFALGVDLPGQVLASKRPVWAPDLALDGSAPRAGLIRESGLRTGFAFPVLVGAEVAAVLEFFSTEAIAADEALIAVLAHVGAQLGRAVERTRAEEALRAAEARYRTLVEQIPTIMYTADLDEHSSTRYVSPQIEGILGFSPEEWMAEPQLWLEQVHPDDREHLLATTACVQTADELIPVEYRTFTRDGRIVWLQEVSRVVRDEAGEPLFLQGITLDITERKHAEEALRESEERFRTLFETMAQGVVYERADGKIISANPSAERILGLTVNQMSSRDSFDPRWKAIHEDWTDFPDETHPATIALKTGEEIRGVVMGVFNPNDEHYHWISINAMPQFRSGEDRPYQVYTIFEDITERKQAEAALVEERALLARRVAERTAELSAANAQLARAARLKDEFLASMSHELRTPLNAILGFSEALQEEVYGPVNDQQARSLRSIEESGHHLLDLINDILDLAKIDAGKLELDLDLVAIEPICAASLRLVNQAAHKKQITVESRIDPAITSLSVDARRLKQILVNLLSNAVKFTPKGGRIGLEVAGDASQQVAHLSVWDTGIGIAQHELERLFQPFVQLDSRLARQYEGTGLGLALVYRMVAMHGGSIAVSSEVGAGSRFTISLPWHAQEQRRNGDMAAELPAANAIGLTAIRTALIIEDSAIAADQLARYLHELGVVTTTRTSGGEGIAQALEAQPDLIISDILLPDISGWDVLTRLKAEPRTQSIPVVLASVMDDRSQSLALGAAEHLVKPFTRQDIQRLLRRLRPGGASDERAMINPGDANAPVILLVEDNEANIANVTDYLSARGYQVVASRNGVEVIGRAREVRPAVILMDIQMPGMDGLDAMRHIRADANLAAIPIVALTALAMPGDRERCLKAGASDYLSKPVSLQRLAGVVEIYVGHPPLVGRG